MDLRVPDYDPRVIEAFAERLYDKAAAFVVGSVVAGAALGAAFGAVPLTSLGENWPIPSMFGMATMMIGAIAGAVLGYRVGDVRSFAYKLQAQAALCQLQIERNTAAAAAAAAAPATPTPIRAPQLPPAPLPAAEPTPPAEPELRPVVVPPEASLTGYAGPLRVAAPPND